MDSRFSGYRRGLNVDKYCKFNILINFTVGNNLLPFANMNVRLANWTRFILFNSAGISA